MSPPGEAPEGLLLLDKPRGVTSHDVVDQVRTALGTRKVGHAGTLDPMATGVLVVGVDRATKLLTYLVGAGKEYLATVRLGVATVTDDAEGEVSARRNASPATPEAVAAAREGAKPAGEPDPYKKPREVLEVTDLDEDEAAE